MARIVDKLKDSGGRLRNMSAQDYANLTAKDKEELTAELASRGETFDDYEKRIKKLFPKEVEMPPIHWVGK